MRYADSLLTEGEVVVLRTRQHWLALLVRARAGVFVFVAGILLLGLVIFLNVAPGVARDVLGGLAAIMLVLGVIIFVYRLWHWWAQDYIVTNRRLLKVTGILNKRSGDSSLEKINDAILIQPMLGRLLNYGDLEILTAAEMANDRYRMLKAPKEFKKTMLTQKHSLETEFAYTRPPSPPMRADEPAETPAAPPPQPSTPVAAPAEATTPAEATAPAAPAASAAPAEPVEPVVPTEAAAAVDDPDGSREITETLARLADLRDSGAITADEYQAKKDELLGRL